MATTVLFLGATGYIGGSVLISLIKAHPEVIFKALVRSDADIPLVAATGATTTKDSLKDYEALSEKVAQADIIFNGADCDDVALNESILKGLKKRFDQGRGVGTLVHTSGTASFMDGGKEGRYNPEARVWTDSEEEIKEITPDFLHGKVDVPILKAGEEGYINSFIVAPSSVVGRGLGPVKKMSPYLIGAYLEKGYPFYIGEGSNLYSVIHIEDLVEVYKLVFKKALEAGNRPLATSPYSRFYFVTSEAVPGKRSADAYARALFERRKVAKPESVKITFEEGGPFAFAYSGNMYVSSVQTKALGWEPKFKITDDVLVAGMDDWLANMKL